MQKPFTIQELLNYLNINNNKMIRRDKMPVA